MCFDETHPPYFHATVANNASVTLPSSPTRGRSTSAPASSGAATSTYTPWTATRPYNASRTTSASQYYKARWQQAVLDLAYNELLEVGRLQIVWPNNQLYWVQMRRNPIELNTTIWSLRDEFDVPDTWGCVFLTGPIHANDTVANFLIGNPLGQVVVLHREAQISPWLDMWSRSFSSDRAVAQGH